MPPKVIYLLAILGGLALIAALISRAKKLEQSRATGDDAASLPYRKKDYLLSKAERSFYFVLLQAIGDGWRVFPKVRMLDLLWLPRGTANASGYRNRVQSKHIDFVLCSRERIEPALVIELDDASHERKTRAARDAFVDEALRAAGIPILHVRAQRSYNVRELAEQIASLTKLKAADTETEQQAS